MKPLNLTPKPVWTAGTCCHKGCGWTLVTPCGAGQFLCWMHYLLLGLPL